MAWNELWRLRLEPNETSVAIRAEGHHSREHVTFIVQKDDVLALLDTWGLIPKDNASLFKLPGQLESMGKS